MGAATAALSTVAAVEATPDPAAQTARPWAGRRAGLAQCHEWSRSLVERWSVPSEPGLSCCLLYAPGTGLTDAGEQQRLQCVR